MAGGTREFMLKIVADVKDAMKGIDQVSKSGDTMKTSMSTVGKTVAGALATTAVINFGRESIQAAAEAELAMAGVQKVFGDSADEIEAFSTKAITSMGISDDAYQAFATTTGGLLKDMGVPMENTIQMTDDLAQRGADLATVYGVDAEQAFTALQKGIGGSYRGLKELGINLDKNEVSARAMAEGWVDAEGNVTDAGMAMAANALIMEKSASSAGAFSDTSGSVAQQQKILALQFEETKETIGNALLPTVQKLMGAFIPLLEFTAKYADVLLPIAGIIGGIVLANKAYELGQTAVKVATAAWTGVQWLLNAALTANPIGLIVAGIAALVAGFVLAYQKVDWFRAGVDAALDGIVAAFNWMLNAVQTVWNWISANWPLLLAIITGPFGIAVTLIVKNWDTIKNAASVAIDAIKGFVSNVWDIISSPFKRGAQVIGDAWEAVKNAASGAVTAVTARIAYVAEIISAPFKRGSDMVKTAWEAVSSFFRDLPNKISGWMSNVASTITAPFRSAFSSIRSLWNNTVGGFGFTIPSWVPGVGGKSFRIPSMAAGGIVTRPTVALIGEAGPEAVVPLSRGSGYAMGTTVINVYALTANAEVGRRVYEALREYDRTSGRIA